MTHKDILKTFQELLNTIRWNSGKINKIASRFLWTWWHKHKRWSRSLMLLRMSCQNNVKLINIIRLTNCWVREMCQHIERILQIVFLSAPLYFEFKICVGGSKRCIYLIFILIVFDKWQIKFDMIFKEDRWLLNQPIYSQIIKNLLSACLLKVHKLKK